MAGVLLAIFAAAAAPSPLFLVYQQRWGFDSWLITFAFAVYALALLLALLMVGSLSDFVGRRRVLTVSMALMVVAMLMFLLAPSIWFVVAARIVQGIATGAATGAVSAAIGDLTPEGNAGLGPRVTALAPLGGLAIGALLSGATSQFSPDPIRYVFLTFTVVFCIATVFVVLASDTISDRHGALRSLRPHVSVPNAARGAFVRAAPLIASSWMVGGFYLGLVSIVMRSALSIHSDLVNGATIAALNGVGCLSVFVLRNTTTRRAGTIAAACLIAGLLICATAVQIGAPLPFETGTLIAGVGFGAAFSSTLRAVVPLVSAHERGELFAAIYVVSYLSFGLPAIAAGFLAQSVGIGPTVLGYAGLIVVAATVALIAQQLKTRPQHR